MNKKQSFESLRTEFNIFYEGRFKAGAQKPTTSSTLIPGYQNVMASLKKMV